MPRFGGVAEATTDTQTAQDEAPERGEATSVARNTAAGAISGFAAGVITSFALHFKGGFTGGFFGLEPTSYGVFWQLVVCTALGASCGALFKRYAGAYAAAISGGVLVGLIWWIIWPLSLLPLAAGDTPTWNIEAMGATFAYLVALMLAGGIAGLLAYLALIRGPARPKRPTPDPAQAPKPVRIAILGGGFGGTACAKRLEKLFLRRTDIEITVVSQSNFLLFTPMLAEVASSSVQPSNISAPVRASVRRARFVRAEVDAIDLGTRTVTLYGGAHSPAAMLEFDHLVLGLGSVPNFYGNPGMDEYAFTLKTLEDANRLRDHVLTQLELAESEPDPVHRRRLLSFVVAGGGFAGTEMIAELFDLVHSVRRLFPNLNPDELRFVLVHSRDRILPELSAELAEYSQRKLESRGIEFALEKRVASADVRGIEMTDGSRIETRTFVWTAGNAPNPVLATLDVASDKRGAVICNDCMQVLSSADTTEPAAGVWALGDNAVVPDPDNPGDAYPPTAQHAIRQGTKLADNVHAAIGGHEPKPFRFKTIGILVALGHRTAAAEIYGLRFSGLLAWFMWRTIYLAKLPGLEKKTRVLFDWTLDMFFPRDIVLEAPPRRRPARREPGSKEKAGI